MAAARAVLEDVDYAVSAYAAAEGASATVIVTEWDAFRALDLARPKAGMAEPLLIDLRNVYSPAQVAEAGRRHVGLGPHGTADARPSLNEREASLPAATPHW